MAFDCRPSSSIFVSDHSVLWNGYAPVESTSGGEGDRTEAGHTVRFGIPDGSDDSMFKLFVEREVQHRCCPRRLGQRCLTNATSSQRLGVALRRSLGRHDPPEYGRLQRTHLAGQGSQSPASHVPRAVRIRTGVVTPGARHYQRTSCTDFPYGAIWRSCAPGTPRTATRRASNPAGLRGRRCGQADL